MFAYSDMLDFVFLKIGKYFDRIPFSKYLVRYVHWIMWHYLPIVKNRIVIKERSNRYVCNPKAIADFLRQNYQGEYDVWFIVDDYLNECIQGINQVKISNSISYYYIIHTSHILIYNEAFAAHEPKRKGQIQIETMHGSFGIKKIGLDDSSSSWKDSFIKGASSIDLAISSSSLFTNIILRGSYGYKGEVLESGSPRNDIFFLSEEDARKKRVQVHQQLNIPDDTHILLYAPTFRRDLKKAAEDGVYSFGAAKVLSSLEQRLGGTWCLAIHVHPYLRQSYKQLFAFGEHGYVDASIVFPDIQDLLPFVDALITDYSSVEMDFMITKRPIFQFCVDCTNFERGFYLQPQDLPFPFAESAEELVNNIENFSMETYQKDLAVFMQRINIKDDGNATKRVCEWIRGKI